MLWAYRIFDVAQAIRARCGNEGKETEQQASGTLNMVPICAEQEHTRRRRGYAARPLQNQVGTLVCIGNGLGV